MKRILTILVLVTIFTSVANASNYGPGVFKAGSPNAAVSKLRQSVSSFMKQRSSLSLEIAVLANKKSNVERKLEECLKNHAGEEGACILESVEKSKLQNLVNEQLLLKIQEVKTSLDRTAIDIQAQAKKLFSRPKSFKNFLSLPKLLDSFLAVHHLIKVSQKKIMMDLDYRNIEMIYSQLTDLEKLVESVGGAPALPREIIIENDFGEDLDRYNYNNR